MDFIRLRVDLPSFSHSFLVQLPISSTIIDLKHEIFRSCIGAPRVDGQRIIWRGRNLLDHERIHDIWDTKSPNDLHVVHLAVHPSAWSSAPPQPPQTTTTTAPVYSPRPSQPAPALHYTLINHPTAFLHFKHENALLALVQARTIPASDRPDLTTSRAIACSLLESRNYSWPVILDQDFPDKTEGGLQYERVVIEGKCYLQLRNPDEKPTPFQLHALKVLTYTFPLLNMFTPLIPITPLHQMPVPPHINQVLQQVGLPPIRLPDHVNLHPAQNRNALLAREIPIRPLVAPIAMFLVRTLLLLYFVVPARKPVIGVVILAWAIYEGWGPIRDALRRALDRGAEANRAGQNNPAGDVPNVQPAGQGPPPAPGGAGAEQGQAQAPPPTARDNGRDNQAMVLLDGLANINLREEEQAIHPSPGALPREPGIFRKIMTFFGLLILTMHPALWDRRRTALRQREGRVRTEANARESASSEGAVTNDERGEQARAQLINEHERRPVWVRRYMERVRNSDWVDDSD